MYSEPNLSWSESVSGSRISSKRLAAIPVPGFAFKFAHLQVASPTQIPVQRKYQSNANTSPTQIPVQRKKNSAPHPPAHIIDPSTTTARNMSDTYSEAEKRIEQALDEM
jgi:hypothetical protein